MKREIICGLDIGTTKLAAAIGEFSPGNKFMLLGKGSVLAEGIERGRVLDMEEFTGAVEKLMLITQSNREIKPDRIIIGIGTDYLRIHSYRRTSNISEKGKEIRSSDIEKLLNSALDMSLPLDHELVHIFPQEFSVDGQAKIKDPKGMFGSKISVRVLIVSAPASLMYNVKKCIYNAGYDVDNIVFSGLGSSFASLTEEEKNTGVIFIEMGGGITSIIKFKEGYPVFLEIIPFGGIDVDGIIAKALSIPLAEANRLKNNHGGLFLDGQNENRIIVDKVGFEVPKNKLEELISSATERVLFQIKRKLENSNMLDYNPSGIVLSGGAFLLDGLVEKVEDFFHMPARLGVVRNLEDWTEDKKNLSLLLTSIGLIYFDRFNRNKEFLSPPEGNFFQKLLYKTKGVFEEYF